MNIDQMRKGAESLPTDAYEKMNYFESCIFSITRVLQFNVLLTTGELSHKLKEEQSRYEKEVR